MGLFDKKPKPVETPEERAAREERGRLESERNLRESERILREGGRKLQKGQHSMAKSSGFPTEGALAVLHEGIMTPKCLVVREEQIEFFTKETGALWQSTNGRHLILPMKDVTSVEIKRQGGDNVVFGVSGGTGGFSVKTHKIHADHVKRVLDEILERRDRNSPSAPEAPVMGGEKSPTEVLTELAALHAAGVLSDEEFSAKKAEILGRM